MSIVYFKDAFMEESECRISPHDRAFRFGDGLFETMLVANGRVYDMEGHRKRLERGLKQFGFNLDIGNLSALCMELIQRNTLAQGFVRAIISRGVDEGGGTYKIQSSRPYLLLTAMQKPYPLFREISLWQSSQVASFRSPAKTSSALSYVLAMQEAVDNGCDNALLLDRDGHICETASGNLFWVKADTLYTPTTTLSLVPGTMRARVLALWEGACEEGIFTPAALAGADEIFMSNTGVIIAPVTKVEPAGLTLPAGRHTRRLRQRLDEDIRQ